MERALENNQSYRILSCPCPRRTPYFEQLNAHASEHELQEECDEHDIADGLDGDDDALHDVLENMGLDRERSTVVARDVP